VGLRRGTASGSCCWQSTARRGGWAELGQRSGGVARAEEGQRGGARAAAGLEVTHGSYQSRRWHRQDCSDGERRRSAAAEREQLGRMAERRGVLGEGQQEGGEAVGELGGDAWSGARGVVGLGRCSNGSRRQRCRVAEEGDRGRRGGRGCARDCCEISKTLGTSQ
jgi:hypothetical protein